MQSSVSISAPAWLPPRYEWDFRSVTAQQCRLACLWEYARSDKTITTDPEGWHIGRNGKRGKGANTILGHYLLCDLGVLDPWVKIHDLEYTLFTASDLKSPASLASKFRQCAAPLDAFLWRKFRTATRRSLSSPLIDDNTQPLASQIADEFNRIIRGRCIHTSTRFAGIQLESATKSLLNRTNNRAEDVIRLNRMLLEDAYPVEIVRGRAWQPQHWCMCDVWSGGAATQIRPLPEVKEKIKQEVAAGGELAKVLDRHLENIGYLLVTDLFYGKTKDILKEFKSWVSEEKKKFPDRPTGRASEPPYEKLKWLSAYRLEQARKLADGDLAELKNFLIKEDQGNLSGAPTLPIYASHGAWSKAVGDAAKYLRRLRRSPAQFEFEILF